MASFVSEFLKRKLEERNLSIDGFASSMGITLDLASKYLSESGRYLPSDRVAKKISMILKLTREEESEFLRNLDQDRDKMLPSDEVLQDEKGPTTKSSISRMWIFIIISFCVSLFSLALSILNYMKK